MGAHVCMILVIVVETIVLTCSLNAEQRERSSLRLPHNRVSGRRAGAAAEEDNPFASYVYEGNA